MSHKEKNKLEITPAQLIIVVVYILYVVYKYIYGKGSLGKLDPFYLLLLEVVQYMLAIFIGKKLGGKLTDFLMQQIEVLVNPEMKPEQIVMTLENLVKWTLIDINKYYDSELQRFQEHMKKKGYMPLALNMHPEEKKDAPKEEEKKE